MKFYGTTIKVNGLTGEIEMFSNLTMNLIFSATIPDHELRRKVEKGIRLAENEALKMAGMQAAEAIQSLSNQ